MKKKIDIKNYEIKFLDEYEDLVSDFFFSSKKRLNKNPLDNSGSIENYFFKIQNSIPLLSVYFKKYFLQEYDFKTNDLLKFNQSLKFLIDECGDKPLNKYDLNDLKVLNQTISQNLKFTKI